MLVRRSFCRVLLFVSALAAISLSLIACSGVSRMSSTNPGGGSGGSGGGSGEENAGVEEVGASVTPAILVDGRGSAQLSFTRARGTRT